MSTSPSSHAAALDTGRGSLLPARALGALLWASLLLALGAGAYALVAADHAALGLALALASLAATTWLPAALRRATRHHPRRRAAADGATTLHRATLVGAWAASGAVVAAGLTHAVGAAGAAPPAATLATYLAGAIALLVLALAWIVLLPGALMAPQQPARALRLAAPALLVATAALTYPTAPALRDALEAFALGATPTAAALGLFALAGLVSALAVGAGLWLLPRPVAALDVDDAGRFALAARPGGARLVPLEATSSPRRFAEGARCARFAPDGASFALDAGAGEVVVRRTADGAVLRRLVGAPAAPTALAFSSDGATLVAAGEGDALSVWSLAEGATDAARMVRSGVAQAASVAVTGQGQGAVVVHATGGGARVALGGRPAHEALGAPVLDGAVGRAALSRDGATLAAAVGPVGQLDRVAVLSLASGAGRSVQGWPQTLAEPAREVALGARGAHLAVTTAGGEVRLYERSGGLVGAASLAGAQPSAVAVDGAGRRVAVGGRWALWCWEPAGGAPRRV